MTKLTGGTGLQTCSGAWGNSRIIFPGGAPENWHNVFNGETVRSEKDIAPADLLSKFPVAMLTGNR
jgi:maltooligosyltrehalose synthase